MKRLKGSFLTALHFFTKHLTALVDLKYLITLIGFITVYSCKSIRMLILGPYLE